MRAGLTYPGGSKGIAKETCELGSEVHKKTRRKLVPLAVLKGVEH